MTVSCPAECLDQRSPMCMGGGREGSIHFNWPNTNTPPVESELKIAPTELITARLDSAQASVPAVVYIYSLGNVSTPGTHWCPTYTQSGLQIT